MGNKQTTALPPIRHTLIADKAEEYAEAMCQGDPDAQFGKGGIAAAYIIGGAETLQRIRNVIAESSRHGGEVNAVAARRILGAVDMVEGLHSREWEP